MSKSRGMTYAERELVHRKQVRAIEQVQARVKEVEHDALCAYGMSNLYTAARSNKLINQSQLHVQSRIGVYPPEMRNEALVAGGDLDKFKEFVGKYGGDLKAGVTKLPKHLVKQIADAKEDAEEEVYRLSLDFVASPVNLRLPISRGGFISVVSDLAPVYPITQPLYVSNRPEVKKRKSSVPEVYHPFQTAAIRIVHEHAMKHK